MQIGNYITTCLLNNVHLMASENGVFASPVWVPAVSVNSRG